MVGCERDGEVFFRDDLAGRHGHAWLCMFRILRGGGCGSGGYPRTLKQCESQVISKAVS